MKENATKTFKSMGVEAPSTPVLKMTFVISVDFNLPHYEIALL